MIRTCRCGTSVECTKDSFGQIEQEIGGKMWMDMENNGMNWACPTCTAEVAPLLERVSEILKTQNFYPHMFLKRK